MRVSVLYTTSDDVEGPVDGDLAAAGYSALATRHPHVTFVREVVFADQLRRAVSAAVGAIMFLVDDVVFHGPFDAAAAVDALAALPSLVAYHWKLHPGVCFNHPASAYCKLPTMLVWPGPTAAGEGVGDVHPAPTPATPREPCVDGPVGGGGPPAHPVPAVHVPLPGSAPNARTGTGSEPAVHVPLPGSAPNAGMGTGSEPAMHVPLPGSAPHARTGTGSEPAMRAPWPPRRPDACPPHTLLFRLGDGTLDWDYPWDLCGSVYRATQAVAVLDHLATTCPSALSHPNRLEEGGAALHRTGALAGVLRKALGGGEGPTCPASHLPAPFTGKDALLCACPASAVLAVVTVNRVQHVFGTPVCVTTNQRGGGGVARQPLVLSPLCSPSPFHRCLRVLGSALVPACPSVCVRSCVLACGACVPPPAPTHPVYVCFVPPCPRFCCL